MSDKDEQALDVHKRTFKEEKRRYAIVSQALKPFSDEIHNWKSAHSAIAYLYERNKTQKRLPKDDISLDTLLLDLIRVYVLNSLTTTMTMVCSGQVEEAARILTGASIACYQFLEKDEIVTKQAIKYTERIINVVKKNPQCAELKAAFELQVQKMKRPDKLSPTDFVQPELPPVLIQEFEEIKVRNEELPEAELWNTDSLCFRYYNILHQYKTTK